MTIRELRELLSDYDPDLDVVVDGAPDWAAKDFIPLPKDGIRLMAVRRRQVGHTWRQTEVSPETPGARQVLCLLELHE
jgi:hypothetical protein